jgi:hypothetical protein
MVTENFGLLHQLLQMLQLICVAFCKDVQILGLKNRDKKSENKTPKI